MLADWLTAPENPYFSRAITNRVWANFFGVGLVESVDDLRLTNPPSNAALFDAAANYLVEHELRREGPDAGDSRSRPRTREQPAAAGERRATQRFYSRYYPRRMMAEVLLDALSQVSGSPTKFGGYAPG